MLKTQIFFTETLARTHSMFCVHYYAIVRCEISLLKFFWFFSVLYPDSVMPHLKLASAGAVDSDETDPGAE